MSPSSTLSPGPHICRRDDQAIQGWIVRCQKRDNKLERLFSDRTHGGTAQALAAAQAWRDAQAWYVKHPQAATRPVPDKAPEPSFSEIFGRALAQALEKLPRQGDLAPNPTIQPRAPAKPGLRTKPPAPIDAALVPGMNIYRNGRSWLASVSRRDYKDKRRFRDNEYGGMAQALAAAQAWRAQQPWYRPGVTRKPPAKAAQVTRHESLLEINGQQRLCAFWSVSWEDAKGKAWTRKFSVNFFGEEVARQKAQAICAQQQRGVQAR